MKKRLLGDTGIEVSVLSLGTVKIGRNQQVKYPQPFELPSDKAVLDLLACAKDCGINMLDTAPAYGHSEERLGQLLKNRHEWIICTKAGEEFAAGKSDYNFSEQHINNSVKRSCRRLGTDYLDVVLIHSNGDDLKIIHDDGVFATMSELKRKGYIRAFGMSTKTIDGAMLTIAHSDVAMISYNPMDNEHEGVLAVAEKKNKGILVKKALASGHITKLANQSSVQQTFQFILQHKSVSSIVVGTINTKHLLENVTYCQ